MAARLERAGRRDPRAARGPHRRGKRSGAPRTTPLADDLAARQGRRRRAGCASRRSVGGRPPRRSGGPGAAAYPASVARRCCEAATQRARGGVLPSRLHGGGAIAGDSKGCPLGTAPRCQGTRTTLIAAQEHSDRPRRKQAWPSAGSYLLRRNRCIMMTVRTYRTGVRDADGYAVQRTYLLHLRR